MSEPQKPLLRVVQPGEAVPPLSSTPSESEAETQAASEPLPSWTAIPCPSVSSRSELDYLVSTADLRKQRCAMRLAAAGRALVSGALDLRHYAAEARPGAFLRGVTPGEKSTEALGVVLGTHQAETQSGAWREAELRRAVLDASAEVVQAVEVAASVGLDTSPRAKALYESAASLLAEAEKLSTKKSRSSTNYLYLVGAQSRSRVEGEEEKKDRTLMVALVAGLVGGLAVVAALG